MGSANEVGQSLQGWAWGGTDMGPIRTSLDCVQGGPSWYWLGLRVKGKACGDAGTIGEVLEIWVGMWARLRWWESLLSWGGLGRCK